MAVDNQVHRVEHVGECYNVYCPNFPAGHFPVFKPPVACPLCHATLEGIVIGGDEPQSDVVV